MSSTNNSAQVTVAIPFYNAQTYLAEAIESVLAQTYTHWELLLIDDGSTDDSLQIAQRYAEGDARVRLYTDGSNKNLGYRLNQIPTLVSTPYLARMDADDIMHPKRLERQMAVLEANPTIDVLGTNAYTINANSEVVGIRHQTITPGKLLPVKGFIHPTILAKTAWFRNNPYDVDAVRVEDMELWYRVADQSNFQMLAEPLLFYREFGQNYYQKYFKSQSSKTYLLNKYPNDTFWSAYFRNNKIKGALYYAFHLVGQEGFLIQKRNQVHLPKLSIKAVLHDKKN